MYTFILFASPFFLMTNTTALISKEVLKSSASETIAIIVVLALLVVLAISYLKQRSVDQPVVEANKTESAEISVYQGSSLNEYIFDSNDGKSEKEKKLSSFAKAAKFDPNFEILNEKEVFEIK